ncbi:hypothetical protein M0R45_005101 [Rubus argutus]|uniref:Uncharacterized protein n=1 Tax=Rubus argutus TaxID=59490 RepID=A0AAW1YLW2_RUBAR
MESKDFQPGLPLSEEPSFSSYASSTLAVTAARVSMEESWVDYNFEFDLVPKYDNNVFPIFNHDVLLLAKSQQDHVEVIKKDDDDDSISSRVVLPPPSSEVVKPEVKPVKYKKSNSTGAWLRRWSSLKSSLRRSNSERGAGPKKANKPEQARKVFPVFNRDVHPLDKLSQQDHVEAVTKDDGSVSSSVAVPPPSISEVDKPEGVKPVKYMKKSKSTGMTTLLRCWSLKGLLRRSNSEAGAPRRTNMTEEGKEDSFVFSRSSSFPKKEGQVLAWDGCIPHLCPCLSSPPVDQEQALAKEKKTSSKSSTGLLDGSKHNNSEASKGPNHVHNVYLAQDSKSRQASSPYRKHAILFFPSWSDLVRISA